MSPNKRRAMVTALKELERSVNQDKEVVVEAIEPEDKSKKGKKPKNALVSLKDSPEIKVEKVEDTKEEKVEEIKIEEKPEVEKTTPAPIPGAKELK